MSWLCQGIKTRNLNYLKKMFSYLSFFIVPVEYAPWSVAAQTGVGSTTRYRKSAVNCPLHSRKDQKTELGHGWRRLPCLKQECSLESQEYSGRLLLSTSLQGSWAHEQTKTAVLPVGGEAFPDSQWVWYGRIFPQCSSFHQEAEDCSQSSHC